MPSFVRATPVFDASILIGQRNGSDVWVTSIGTSRQPSAGLRRVTLQIEQDRACAVNQSSLRNRYSACIARVWDLSPRTPRKPIRSADYWPSLGW